MPVPIQLFGMLTQILCQIAVGFTEAFISSLVNTKVYVSSLMFLGHVASLLPQYAKTAGLQCPQRRHGLFVEYAGDRYSFGLWSLIGSSAFGSGVFSGVGSGLAPHPRPPAPAGWYHPYYLRRCLFRHCGLRNVRVRFRHNRSFGCIDASMLPALTNFRVLAAPCHKRRWLWWYYPPRYRRCEIFIQRDIHAHFSSHQHGLEASGRSRVRTIWRRCCSVLPHVSPVLRKFWVLQRLRPSVWGERLSHNRQSQIWVTVQRKLSALARLPRNSSQRIDVINSPLLLPARCLPKQRRGYGTPPTKDRSTIQNLHDNSGYA